MMDKSLANRANNQCELCSAQVELEAFTVAPNQDQIAVCKTCLSQLNEEAPLDENHWRCLNDSMWSEVDAVKVVSYRLLHALRPFGWSQDLLDMMYLEDDVKKWAEEGIVDEDQPVHRDSNGVPLEMGDSIVLIKDLKVKGGGFTAKRGTPVRNIRLVHDNVQQIEGKVEGQTVVILTEYVKK